MTLTRFLNDSEESTRFIVLQLSSCCLSGFDRRETCERSFAFGMLPPNTYPLGIAESLLYWTTELVSPYTL